MFTITHHAAYFLSVSKYFWSDLLIGCAAIRYPEVFFGLPATFVYLYDGADTVLKIRANFIETIVFLLVFYTVELI